MNSNKLTGKVAAVTREVAKVVHLMGSWDSRTASSPK
jgi:hypothetical protein